MVFQWVSQGSLKVILEKYWLFLINWCVMVVSRIFKGSYKSVSRGIKRVEKVVLKVFKASLKVVQNCILGMSVGPTVLLENIKGVSRYYQRCYKNF